MTSPNRSLLQVDLKDLGAKPSTPVLRHLGLVSAAAGVLFIVYTLINAPSASISDAPVANQPELAEPEIREQELPTAFPQTASIASTTPASPTPVQRAYTDHDHLPAQVDAAVVPAPLPGLPDTPSPNPATPTTPPNDAPDYRWDTATVKRHDTLSQIFARHGLPLRDAYAVAKLEGAGALRKIHPGDEIQLAADDAGALAALRYRLDTFSTLGVERAGDGALRAVVTTRSPEIRLRSAKAVIRTSLLGAAEEAGVDFETVYGLAQLFGWQVDFNREIRAGDQFTVFFQGLYLDGKKVGNGDILAAELMVSNRRLRAIRHLDSQGRVTWYAPDGDGIQRSFLRSPLEFARVTSRFSHKRYHPIFKQWRAHRGVDYGASRGTPVRATGDGVVTRAGRHRGYGKHITIRHGGKYTTLYAHLNGFAKGVKSGARVRQGEVIGYVGSTGWATGPHLHYEFRVNGVHQNPLTVELPKSDPIAPPYRAEFLVRAGEWVARLDEVGVTDLTQLDHPQ